MKRPVGPEWEERDSEVCCNADIGCKGPGEDLFELFRDRKEELCADAVRLPVPDHAPVRQIRPGGDPSENAVPLHLAGAVHVVFEEHCCVPFLRIRHQDLREGALH